MKIIPVILCGGSGTRLWPISRTNLPKQFSDFFGEQTLFQKTILRYNADTNFTSPLIICNEEHRFIVASQLQQINVEPLAIILEPTSKNTASAVAIASLYVQQHHHDCLMMITPADHIIIDAERFLNQAFKASETAKADYIVTFGIKPSYPETGYGYIEKTNKIISNNNNIYTIANFIEKPNLEVAKNLIADDKYFWNSGILLLKADLYIKELGILASNLLSYCQESLIHARPDLDFIRLEAHHFNQCPNISVDYAILEKSSKIALMTVDIDWSDVGSWRAIADLAPHDSDHNTLIGNVINHQTRNCYINSLSKQLIATAGIDNLVITATQDVILIAEKNHATGIKDLYLKALELNPEYCHNHLKTLRPWGSFEIISIGTGYKIKKLP